MPAGAPPLPVTVLICSRGRPGMLFETVQSVLAGHRVPEELVVVDQSADRHQEIAGLGEVRGCAVRYMHSATSGLSRARNIGLRAAARSPVILVDDDMFVEPQWLERLISGWAEGGARTVATGRVLAAPSEGGGQVPPAGLVTLDRAEIYHGRQRRDVVPGANVAIPREVVLELGGYDERLGAGTRFGGAEDNDIGLRLLDAGCEVRHIPDAVMLHRAWRSREARLRLRWAYALGKGAFYAKHAHLHDPYTLRRLSDDIGSRSRRLLRAGIRRPRSLAGEAVTIVGLLSGFLSWTVLERVPRAAGRPRAQR